MTIKELKAQLSQLDDNYEIKLQTPDGTQRDITKVGQQGQYFTFWTDSTF